MKPGKKLSDTFFAALMITGYAVGVGIFTWGLFTENIFRLLAGIGICFIARTLARQTIDDL